MRREAPVPSSEYLASRAQAVAEIMHIDLGAAADVADDVIALIADIPVRSRFITLTCTNDGTVGVYYSSGEKLPRVGRGAKSLPEAGKRMLCCLKKIAQGSSPVSEVDEITPRDDPHRVRVYFRCRDGLHRTEYDNAALADETAGEDARKLDGMLRELMRLIRRLKPRDFFNIGG